MDNIKNCLSVLLIIIFFSACTSHKIVGIYQYRQDFIAHRLELFKDSSFIYIVQGDLSKDETKGKWSYENDKINLTSFEKDFPYQVTESRDNIDRILISIKDLNNVVIAGNFISINNESKKHFVTENGEIEISPITKIKSIKIYSLNGPFSYEVFDLSSNIFNIKYDSSKSTVFYFSNELFDVRPRKIISVKDKLTLKKIRGSSD